jgi:uncharacterized protein
MPRSLPLALILLTYAAAQIPDKPAGYLADAAGVVEAQEAKAIEQRCAELDRAGRAQVAIVIVRSLQGQPIEKVALTLFKKWGIGRKNVNDGLLLMLAIQERKSRLTVGYGLEKIVTDDVAAGILHEMAPSLRAGHYGAALNRALDLLGARLAPAHAQ